MMRAPSHHVAARARALCALVALACLLCSDGVGPRLVPYPAQAEGARQPARSRHDDSRRAAADHQPSRERALITQGLKLSSLKQDKAGGHPAHGVPAGSVSAPPLLRVGAARATTRGHAFTHGLRHTVTAPRRGPPHLS